MYCTLYDFMLELNFFRFKVVYNNGNKNSITELKGFLSIIFFLISKWRMPKLNKWNKFLHQYRMGRLNSWMFKKTSMNIWISENGIDLSCSVCSAQLPFRGTWIDLANKKVRLSKLKFLSVLNKYKYSKKHHLSN